jgi:alkaline phosphatase D
MKRRDFLKATGTFFVTASLAGVPGCGDDGGGGPEPGTYVFPHGVASGDPRDASVVLWTRIQAAAGGADSIDLVVEVATDPEFTQIVVSTPVTATAGSDHTVRVVVDGLAAATTYHYRFTAGVDEIVGRTRTAPAADADVTVRIAWVSCQDYEAGTYAAYRQMIDDDEARPAGERIDFVVHLGDFIYESRGSGFQRPLDDNLEPLDLRNPDGSPRRAANFPSGGSMIGNDHVAETVDDYRHLYKTVLSDPDLRAARARWPFIHSWDDHEFRNDSWQSQGNYTDSNSLDEPYQTVKIAANQAWSEYVPAQLTGSPGVAGVTQRARDFSPSSVQDAPFTTPNEDNFVPEPNNAAAVGSITIYRSFRFGRHVELVMTDGRSYRSDHCVPEELSFRSFVYLDPRNVLPIDDVAILDAGRTANDGNPPAQVQGVPNPRIDSPVGTMLGAQQKAWWKQTMTGSDATWKVWGNGVPFVRFFVRRDPVGSLLADRIMNGDGWDGYPSERRELTTFLRDEGVGNLVILTGDIHAHLVGKVVDDHDAPAPTPIGAEFCAAGISSNSLFSFYEDATRSTGIPPDVRALIHYDASGDGGPRFVENMNLLLIHGTAAASTMASTNDLEQAMAVSDPTANPHLAYADTNAQGYGLLVVGADQAEATLVTVVRPTSPTAQGVRRTARFVVPRDNPDGMLGPTFTGTPPFPWG